MCVAVCQIIIQLFFFHDKNMKHSPDTLSLVPPMLVPNKTFSKFVLDKVVTKFFIEFIFHMYIWRTNFL